MGRFLDKLENSQKKSKLSVTLRFTHLFGGRMLTGAKKESRLITVEQVRQITGDADFSTVDRQFNIKAGTFSGGGSLAILEHEVNLIKGRNGYELVGLSRNLERILAQLAAGRRNLLLWQVNDAKSKRYRLLQQAASRRRLTTDMW